MSRWKAAALHLGISIAVGIFVAALLFGVWYPPPYFHAGGADVLVLLLVCVDLTLGPLLTLIVFRAGKRGLLFDLCVIGLLQAAALVYGMSVVLVSRPVFLVGVLDQFVLVAANEIEDQDLAQGTQAEFRTRSWTGPRLVGAVLPSDPDERSSLVSMAMDGRDLQDLPKYYHPYAEVGPQLATKAKSLDALKRLKPQFYPMITAWLAHTGRQPDNVRWLPLIARKADLVMLLDANSGEPLQAIAIDPW